MADRDGAGGWAAWDRFIEATPNTGFMQTTWWSSFRMNVGYRHFSAILKSDDEIIGGAIVQKYSVERGSCFYYIQEGPVVPDDEEAAEQIFNAVLSEVDRRRAREPSTVSHLRIEPRWTRVPSFVHGFQPAVEDAYFEPRNTLCVDLRPSHDDILAQMRPKGRYNIRVAERSGVTVVEDVSSSGVHDFISLYEDTAKRQDFSAKPSKYFEHLMSALVEAQRGSVFFAEHNGARLAGAIAVWCGNRATYFYGGSSVADRQVMATYLLHWELMRDAKARGLEWYDFWGVSPAEETDAAWSNISVFKRKFGGVDVALAPTLDLVFDERLYERYAEIVSAAPDPVVRELSLVR